jgi:glutaredoxin
LDFLKKVRLMLQTCGIQPKISSGLERGDCILPDGKGGSKLFNVQTTYRMLITSWDLYRLTELGFSPKRLVYPVRKPTRNSRQFIKVMSTSFLDRRDDTYCFTEPKRHMGVFNGILTGQCTEIIEYSNAEETAVCNLASINLQAFINRPPISNDAEITVFTKEGCVHCAILKSYMDEWGISARWVSGPENAEERLAFQTEARCQEPRTYPMVYVREEKEGDLK